MQVSTFDYWTTFEAGQADRKAGNLKNEPHPDASNWKAYRDGWSRPDFQRGGVSNAAAPVAA